MFKFTYLSNTLWFIPIARNSGGHPQILDMYGSIFDGKDDIIEKINNSISNSHNISISFQNPSIDYVGKTYYDFVLMLHSKNKSKKITLYKIFTLFYNYLKYIYKNYLKIRRN